MNKQTAVNWLVEQLNEKAIINGTVDIFVMNNIIEQAKDMEREQIEDAFLTGGNSVFNFQRGNSFQTIENYTEQTYKSE